MVLASQVSRVHIHPEDCEELWIRCDWEVHHFGESENFLFDTFQYIWIFFYRMGSIFYLLGQQPVYNFVQGETFGGAAKAPSFVLTFGWKDMDRSFRGMGKRTGKKKVKAGAKQVETVFQISKWYLSSIMVPWQKHPFPDQKTTMMGIGSSPINLDQPNNHPPSLGFWSPMVNIYNINNIIVVYQYIHVR